MLVRCSILKSFATYCNPTKEFKKVRSWMACSSALLPLYYSKLAKAGSKDFFFKVSVTAVECCCMAPALLEQLFLLNA